MNWGLKGHTFPTALCVDLCGGATGKVETTQERGGSGPGRRSRLLQDNMLNEILVFDLSLATGIYSLTNYARTVMGTRRRGISRSLRDVSDQAARAGLDMNACSCIREARFVSGRPRNVQVCNGRWTQTPAP